MRICVLIILIAYVNQTVCFELLSATLIGVGSILTKYTYCKFKECCTEKEIPANFTSKKCFLFNISYPFQVFVELENLLEEKLYGQHLVEDIVVNALKAHWSGNHAQKPLTMSFHGWPGGGKNYVARFIQDSLFKYGSKSTHVHHFMGRIHFPSENHVEQYKVLNWCFYC